jgi:hypothetical protein
VTMRPSADERKAVSSPPPPWGPPPGPPYGPSYGPPYGQPGWGPPSPYPPLPKAGSARTGPLPLHPMTLGDILDGAFKLLKANVRTIVLVAAVFLVPINLVAGFFQRDLLGGYGFLQLANDPSLIDQANADPSNALLLSAVLAALASFLITPFIGGAVSKIVAASYLGEEPEPGPVMRATARRFLALLGAFFFTLLLKLVGLLVCVVGVLVPMTFFLVTTPAVMVEELGPIQAMARSVTLVRTRFWPVMGIGVLSGLLASVLESILSWPFGLAAGLIGFRWGWILAAIGEILPALVTMPLVAIVATLVYFDLRIRNEGFDLQMIAAELARGAPR